MNGTGRGWRREKIHNGPKIYQIRPAFTNGLPAMRSMDREPTNRLLAYPFGWETFEMAAFGLLWW